MGNLSSQYISQSFQSLLHLGSDTTASATLTALQDGFGNGIGISVNTAGDLKLNGALSAINYKTALMSQALYYCTKASKFILHGDN